MTRTLAFEVNNLSFCYGEATVLEDVSFSLNQGEFLAVIGPNGGGKSTLIKLLLGILHPCDGAIRVLGGNPGSRTSAIGYVPQDTTINRGFPITVKEAAMMGRLGIRRRFPFSRGHDAKVDEALELLGVKQYSAMRMGELSGGQRQRVMIARALAMEPEILILDEPTANIDTVWQGKLYDLLHELNKTITVVIISHDIGVISRHVTSVMCVNRKVHLHNKPEITQEMLTMAYGSGHACHVEMVAHGVPHRVLHVHGDGCKHD